MSETKNRGGRPYAITLDAQTRKTLEGLGHIHASWEECAAVLDISKQTFAAFLQREPEAKELLERAKLRGKVNLRRLQHQAAQKGNSRMLELLGNNWLGQTYHTVISGTGPGGSIAFLDITRLPDLTDEELAVLEKVGVRAAIEQGEDIKTIDLEANKTEDEKE